MKNSYGITVSAGFNVKQVLLESLQKIWEEYGKAEEDGNNNEVELSEAEAGDKE